MKQLYFLFIFCFISLYSVAQWTTDTINNLQLANVNSSDIVTTNIDGNYLTWIAFYSYNQATSNMIYVRN
ncbi:MAG: hypothetical protein ACR2FN_06960 [Chitinophagaceae bacterium]